VLVCAAVVVLIDIGAPVVDEAIVLFLASGTGTDGVERSGDDPGVEFVMLFVELWDVVGRMDKFLMFGDSVVTAVLIKVVVIGFVIVSDVVFVESFG
jgi:hypothetical protein